VPQDELNVRPHKGRKYLGAETILQHITFFKGYVRRSLEPEYYPQRVERKEQYIMGNKNNNKSYDKRFYFENREAIREAAREQAKIASRKNISQTKHNGKRQKISYFAYIGSKEWKKRRERFFRKNGRVCAACESTEQIQLHHLDYSTLGRERDIDLVPLCKICHREYHEQYGKKRLRNNTFEFIEEKQQEKLASDLSKIM
jgi:5-methylcytosine-specific restriction endonuclease McrA